MMTPDRPEYIELGFENGYPVTINGFQPFVVIGLTGRTPQPGQTLRTDGKLGWVYCVKTHTLYATAADGKTILDEQKRTAARR